MRDRAALRRENFFRGTALDPEANTAPDGIITEALAIVKTSIETQARSEGRTLTGIQIDRALSVAQRMLRTMPREDVRSIASSGQLKFITEQSLAVAPASDTRLANIHAAGHTISTSDTASPSRLLPSGLAAGSSSARYGDIGGGTVSAEIARNIEQARHEAIRLGIPWAANQPELLKLGAAAVKALADVNLKHASYNRLTKDAHFAPKDVVTFATYAKNRGIKDANAAAGAVADYVQLGKTPEEQRQIQQGITSYMGAANAAAAAPHDAAAQERYRQEGERFKKQNEELAKRSPQAAAGVGRMQDSLNIPQIHRATATQNIVAAKQESVAASTNAAADVKAAKQNEEISALNDAPSPAQSEPVKTAEAPAAAQDAPASKSAAATHKPAQPKV